jgi:hypothetical protein
MLLCLTAWTKFVGCQARRTGLLFEKRSKNFCSLTRALQQRARLISKSFLVLFSKKELLALPSVGRVSITP